MRTATLSLMLLLGIWASGCGRPASEIDPAAPPSLAPTPQIRAAKEFGAAMELEKAGRSAAAKEAFRKVASDYPDTPQARTAAERVKALGG